MYHVLLWAWESWVDPCWCQALCGASPPSWLCISLQFPGACSTWSSRVKATMRKLSPWVTQTQEQGCIMSQAWLQSWPYRSINSQPFPSPPSSLTHNCSFFTFTVPFSWMTGQKSQSAHHSVPSSKSPSQWGQLPTTFRASSGVWAQRAALTPKDKVQLRQASLLGPPFSPQSTRVLSVALDLDTSGQHILR